MNLADLTEDIKALIVEGIVTDGRSATIDSISGSPHQFRFVAEDGSSAIVTIRQGTYLVTGVTYAGAPVPWSQDPETGRLVTVVDLDGC